MNIWKPVNKKSKKLFNVSPSVESGVALPDVVAGLCYGDTGHEVPSSSEEAMLGYSSYYLESQETRGRRREPRSQHALTPQGIGATPSGAYLHHPPQDLGIVPVPPQGGTLRRSELSQAWPSQKTSDYNWTQSFTAFPSVVDPVAGRSYGAAHSGVSNYDPCPREETFEGARVRSMSSEPHGHHGKRSNGDRRMRCSSATRNRQPRPKLNNPNMPEQHHTDLPSSASTSSPSQCSFLPTTNLCPSTLPPVQRIDYQQNSTAAVPIAGNTTRTTIRTFRGGNGAGIMSQELRDGVDPLSEPMGGATTSRNEELGVLGGGSYGYQVPDLEALLTNASPARPANLPMVLASSTRLHNMRRSQETGSANPHLPVRPILPLGIIVNAVFKTRDWLYVRTAHGAEGYVPYRVCLPLGILPPNRRPFPETSSETIVGGSGGSWELRGGEEGSGASGSNGAISRIVLSKPHTQAGLTGNTVEGATASAQQHLPRGRHRGRRRVNAGNSNQTDMQKLQPSRTQTPLESHGPPRETLDSHPSINHSNIV